MSRSPWSTLRTARGLRNLALTRGFEPLRALTQPACQVG